MLGWSLSHDSVSLKTLRVKSPVQKKKDSSNASRRPRQAILSVSLDTALTQYATQWTVGTATGGGVEGAVGIIQSQHRHHAGRMERALPKEVREEEGRQGTYSA